MDSVSTRPAIAPAVTSPSFESKIQASKTQIDPAQAVQDVQKAQIRADAKDTPIDAAISDAKKVDFSATTDTAPANSNQTTFGSNSFKVDTSLPRENNPSRSLSLDAETQSVILKKTDTKTGEVLEQYPTESQLVLREYSRTQVPNHAILNAEA